MIMLLDHMKALYVPIYSSEQFVYGIYCFHLYINLLLLCTLLVI